MKKFLKRVLLLLIFTGVVLGLWCYGPTLFSLVFGDARGEWIAERFAETLHEKSELVVYEVEVDAQETYTQDAWLIGTVQKVEIPYRFHIRYTIDVSKAEIEAEGNEVVITLPSPAVQYPQLSVDEEHVRVNDWLYPLTPEKYSEIKEDLQQKLVERYSTDPNHLTAAWKHGVRQIENFFEALIGKNLLGAGMTMRVIENK